MYGREASGSSLTSLHSRYMSHCRTLRRGNFVARAGFEPAISGFEVQRANHLATKEGHQTEGH